jgi:hypothetical protein
MMQNQQSDIHATPELFTLHKLQPHEITDSSSRIYCDGHFFPISIPGVNASDYGQAVYRLTEIEPANGIKPATPSTEVAA